MTIKWKVTIYTKPGLALAACPPLKQEIAPNVTKIANLKRKSSYQKTYAFWVLIVLY